MGSPDVSFGELGFERSGAVNSDRLPKVFLDLDIEQTCWDRLWVGLGPVGKTGLADIPFGVNKVVGSLVHGQTVQDILLDSTPDPYRSHSSHCVLSVRIHAVNDLAVGQERAGLVSYPVAYVAIFISVSTTMEVVLVTGREIYIAFVSSETSEAQAITLAVKTGGRSSTARSRLRNRRRRRLWRCNSRIHRCGYRQR